MPSRCSIHFALVLCTVAMIVIGITAASAQTLRDVNNANGFREMLLGIEADFANSFKFVPEPKPEGFQDAWSIAAEGAFDADRLQSAIEARMAKLLTEGELSELAAFFSSPLGRRVTELEMAMSHPDNTERKKTDGARILADLPSEDRERLALYWQMAEDIGGIELGEAISLNVAYSVLAGMMAAAGRSMSDEDMMALVRSRLTTLRQQIEQQILQASAFGYRDLALDELRAYSDFLKSPAGSRYYGQMTAAFSTVVSEEARSFGQRLFVAFGLRKA